MEEASDRIRRVATVFSPQDYAITKSFLEAHGVLVLGTSDNFVIAAARPDSMGGLGIMVPERQAQEAINLLIEIDGVEQAPLKPAEAPVEKKPSNLLTSIGNFFFYNFIAGESNAQQSPSQRIIHGEWKKI